MSQNRLTQRRKTKPKLVYSGRAVDGAEAVLKRLVFNLSHITLPEIKDFNASCDATCLK